MQGCFQESRYQAPCEPRDGSWNTPKGLESRRMVVLSCPQGLSARPGRAHHEAAVDALAEKLDARLRQWKPEAATQVRERVAEVIDLADHGVLDLLRSRATEQEVLDLLDEPTTR